MEWDWSDPASATTESVVIVGPNRKRKCDPIHIGEASITFDDANVTYDDSLITYDGEPLVEV